MGGTVSAYNFFITVPSLEITFETCSGLYLFSSLIEGKFFERLNR